MGELFFEKEQDDLFRYMISCNENCFFADNELYHYRSGNSIKSIINEDAVRLRLSQAESFADKTEGKIVNKYYSIALKDLYESKRINMIQYKELLGYKLPDTMPFISEETETTYLVDEETFDVFIICFCTKKDDPYMYREYVKTKETGGFCLELSDVDVSSLTELSMNNNAHIKLATVLYGEAAIDAIKKEVDSIIQNEQLYSERKILISELLHRMQYITKDSCYSKENEVRMLVYVAKNDNNEHADFEIKKDGKNKYLYFRLPKYMLVNVTADPNNNPIITAEHLNSIYEKGYTFN